MPCYVYYVTLVWCEDVSLQTKFLYPVSRVDQIKFEVSSISRVYNNGVHQSFISYLWTKMVFFNQK